MTEFRKHLQESARQYWERRREKELESSVRTSASVTRCDAIQALRETKPDLAARLRADEIRDSAAVASKEGSTRFDWQCCEHDLKDRVIEILKPHFDILVRCGHGHGWETSEKRCDGTMYSTCSVVVSFSWE